MSSPNTRGDPKEILADGRTRDWHKTIDNPVKLHQRLTRLPEGSPHYQLMLGRADKKVAEMGDEFHRLARGWLEILQTAQLAGTEIGLSREEHQAVEELAACGGTFGYPLASKVAGSLIDFVALKLPVTPSRLKVFQAHLDALIMILSLPLKGDGGTSGQGLLQNLARAVAKVVEPRAG